MTGLLKKNDLVALARALGGVPVFGCLPGSPADLAGIGYGDVVLSIDGHPTPSWDAYLAARERSGPAMRVRLFRDGIEREVDLVLRRGAGLTVETLAAALGLTREGSSGESD
jgi:C-terminal processing protease CtpA/Prc